MNTSKQIVSADVLHGEIPGIICADLPGCGCRGATVTPVLGGAGADAARKENRGLHAGIREATTGGNGTKLYPTMPNVASPTGLTVNTTVSPEFTTIGKL